MSQSLHWHHDQVTVHSSIVKIHDEKSYHPYVSNDHKHDQTFVKLALEEMFSTIDPLPQISIIASDNCSSQYKSAQHFNGIQVICNAIEIPIIRLFGVSSHGKGEVDHIGGLAQVAIRRYIGTGGVVLDTGDCVDFLENKFGQKTNPKFYIKEINADSLNSARHEARYLKFSTIDGSSLFQVMVFKPQNITFKAAPPYICLIWFMFFVHLVSVVNWYFKRNQLAI